MVQVVDSLMVLQAMVMMQEMDKLQSVGYKNIVINDQHINSCGDVTLSVQMTITLENKELHSLSSDLGSLIDDVDSSDSLTFIQIEIYVQYVDEGKYLNKMLHNM